MSRCPAHVPRGRPASPLLGSDGPSLFPPAAPLPGALASEHAVVPVVLTSLSGDAEGLSDTEGELLLLLDEHPAVRRHVSSA